MVAYDNYYRIYLDKVISLSKTIVIKSETTAESINNWVAMMYGRKTIEDDPRTWRYYMNLAGEYHFSNEKMTVVSMDTLEEIEFNKENLEIHRATLAGYQYGTRRYEELVIRYPDQEMLILGILYPANLEQAVKSKDRTILSYPPNLVEENEYSFINQLQDWVYHFDIHHTNRGYGYSDELYPAANLGLLYLNLIPAILTIRKKMCKTNEAHSYHVRQYLASHGFLDDYLDTMTIKQSLRFYQNINWIERNIGKTKTQRWLIREVMTARRLPLADYTLRHDTKHQVEVLKPRPLFKKGSLNDLEQISEIDHMTLDELLAKELPLVKDNPRFVREEKRKIENKLTEGLSNVLQTKVLESKVKDYSNSKDYPLEETLLNLWLDLAGRGIYKAAIHVGNPKTGERVSLNPKDTFVLWWYCYWKSMMNFPAPTIPKFQVNRVPVDSSRARHLAWWANVTAPTKYRGIINKWGTGMRKLLPVQPQVMISIESFYQYGHEVNKAMNEQSRQIAFEPHLALRSYKEMAVDRMYVDRVVELYSEETTYESWLLKNNIDFTKMTREDYKVMARDILLEVTGINLNNKLSIRAIHSAMLRLMTQLSSYSVQYLKEINDENTITAGHWSIRGGDTKGSEHYSGPVLSRVRNVTQRDTSSTQLLDVKRDDQPLDIKVRETSETSSFYHSSVKTLITEDAQTTQMKVRITLGVMPKVPDIKGRNPRGHSEVIGIDTFMDLPLSGQAKLKDAWGRQYWYPDACDRDPNLKEPLAWSFIQKELDGFTYANKPRLALKDTAGFHYDTRKFFRLDKTITGFHYQARPKFSLSAEIEGFHYQEKDKWVLSDVVTPRDIGGFSSNKPEPKKLGN